MLSELTHVASYLLAGKRHLSGGVTAALDSLSMCFRTWQWTWSQQWYKFDPFINSDWWNWCWGILYFKLFLWILSEVSKNILYLWI